ncbi:hypothetical protein QUB12_37495, partial [Microcoleus sp. B7-D4]
AILLGEAIAEYRKRHSLKNTEADLANAADRPADPQPTEPEPTEAKAATPAKAKRGKTSKGAS